VKNELEKEADQN